jgi:transposase
MFIRKKRNPSGVISVQVIDKSLGKYRVLKTIGSSSDDDEVKSLLEKGKRWISNYKGEQDIFELATKQKEESQVLDYLLSNVENILLNGAQILIDKVYKSVGFDQIDDEILKQLVTVRLCQPLSKSATVEYLKSHFDQDVELHKIYRYLDKLHDTLQEKIQQISVSHTRKILGDNIGLLFYDVTTLYFEIEKSDDLRETGFSKDGKHSQPQIVLGLLVSRQGYPLSYSIFNGAQYEGRTMLPIVEDFVYRFKLNDFVIVADSGLMNKTNIGLLTSSGYKYIIGARIKNEKQTIKDWILSLDKEEGQFYEKERNENRLIIGYTNARAKKDGHNRNKGIQRLEQAFKSGTVTKENINKRGYNKFLKISNNVTVKIDLLKVEEDQKWDGLKGYITNTDLPAAEVCYQYNELWIIENAFRVTKATLEMRPIFHFSPKRIQAHISICFIAFKLYKEIERKLKQNKIPLSVDKVLNISKTITTLKVKLPQSGTTISKLMILTPKQKSISVFFDDKIWEN